MPRSSRRWRTGGSQATNPEMRANKSARNCPRDTNLSRSRLVAATTRTSTRIGLVAPIGKISPSCRTRKSAVCAEGDNSPISSRNRVPPSALRTSPGRSLSAPENAPLREPKSSDSISVSGNPPQLTGKNGPRRPESRCMAMATTSLPAPVSPWSPTDTAETAIASNFFSSAASEGTRVAIPSAAAPASLLRKSGGSSTEVANPSRKKKKL